MKNKVISIKGISCLYCYRYMDGHKRYFVKTQCQNRILKKNIDVRSNMSYSELKRIAALVVRKLKDSLTHPKPIIKWVEEYILVKQLKPKTAKAYRRILANYSYDYKENITILSHTLQSGINSSQIARTVKAFFNWLIQNGVSVLNPAANVTIPPSKIRHRTLNQEEIQIFYQALSKCSPEIQLFGRLLLETGARVSSIYSIHIGDLNQDGLYLKNIKCDRDYPMAIPLSKSTLQLWNACLNNHKLIRPDVRIFKTNYYVLCSHLRKLLNDNFNHIPNMERVVIHSLRHTAATVALQNGVSIDMVSRMLDHINIHTTMSIYAKASQKQINQAYQTLFRSLHV